MWLLKISDVHLDSILSAGGGAIIRDCMCVSHVIDAGMMAEPTHLDGREPIGSSGIDDHSERQPS
jgi:hypothetical protein